MSTGSMVMHPNDGTNNPGPGGGGGGGPTTLETPAEGATSAESPQQRFCLRWNNHQTNLINVFDQLLQNGWFVDVTLACDGRSVQAHKVVLSACSPYFQALFTDNPCQHPIVILKDISYSDLKSVVEFMYKGEINVAQEQIGPLLRVAETLKIRGLAEINNEPELKSSTTDVRAGTPGSQPRKRRRRSVERSPENHADKRACPPSPGQGSGSGGQAPPGHPGMAPGAVDRQPPAQGPPQQSQQQGTPGQRDVIDDLDIKPGIAEMIREEERAKKLESSQAWLCASTSSGPVAETSYQEQLQSWWQSSFRSNQFVMNNLRFRERGPLKTWRSETMAEAIMSVLNQGLSLSQAARKFDIPYPTFVLYANRVHNMLGPSADGSADLRPKGRGRPQRILLGYWPEKHIQKVIAAVVFKDPQLMRDEPTTQSYNRYPEPLSLYSGCMNGPEAPVSPSSHASSILAAVHSANQIRQQMYNAAPAASNVLPALANGTPSQSPVNSSSSSPVSNNNLEVGLGVTGVNYEPTDFSTPRSEPIFQEELDDIVSRSTPTSDSNRDQPLPLVIDQRSE
ncbi:protein bric-a-brac 1 isoform X2 [Bemisia tabaci]|uniref:protein bric-a-brac 1 isoform X2 n=2 Tax=Bemisia tabaci TaxID=7038 RepID=UPI003B286E45